MYANVFTTQVLSAAGRLRRLMASSTILHRREHLQIITNLTSTPHLRSRQPWASCCFFLLGGTELDRAAKYGVHAVPTCMN